VIKNLIKIRKAFGCRRREEARAFFGGLLDREYDYSYSKRRDMQLLNTLALAHDSVEKAERNTN
jgi:hypothetical protein